MRCVLCKNAETRSKYINGKSCTVCPICGAIFEDPNDAYLCYGDKKSRGMDVLFTVSDRYIFFHRLKGFERIIYGLGIIFGIIIAMMVRSAKKNRMPYSFVDINDIDHIIAPYKNRKFKKDDAMKFVMKDGTDFIVKVSAVTVYPITRFLEEHGVKVVDGANKNYGLTFCEKPFFKPDDIGRSVAPSAADKIKMLKKNFVASPVAYTNVMNDTTSNVSEPVNTPDPKREVVEQVPPVAPTTKTTVPTPVEELCLRVGTYNALKKLQITFVSQLVDLTEQDLANMGVKANLIAEIRNALAKLNLAFKAPDKVEEPVAPIKADDATIVKQEEVVEDSAPVAQEQPTPKKDPNVKFCRKCGEKLRRDDVFCMECGADQR